MTEDQFMQGAKEAENQKRGVIVMYEDTDGNWQGGYRKKGESKEIYLRDVGPQTLVQLLITHD